MFIGGRTARRAKLKHPAGRSSVSPLLQSSSRYPRRTIGDVFTSRRKKALHELEHMYLIESILFSDLLSKTCEEKFKLSMGNDTERCLIEHTDTQMFCSFIHRA